MFLEVLCAVLFWTIIYLFFRARNVLNKINKIRNSKCGTLEAMCQINVLLDNYFGKSFTIVDDIEEDFEYPDKSEFEVKINIEDIKIDQKMTNKFSEIYHYWFPNTKYQDFWFSHERDTDIKNKFGLFLEQLSKYDVSTLASIIHCSENQLNIMMAILVCLDQFTRNIYRTNNNKRNDDLSFDLAKYCYACGYHMQLPINERIFFFLVFRHQRLTRWTNMVIQEIKIMEKENKEIIHTDKKRYREQLAILTRYRNETLKGMSCHTDTIRVISDEKKVNHHLTSDMTVRERILDDYCLKNYSLKPLTSFDNIKSTKLYKCIDDFLTDNKCNRPCISLSGGVDSMVISYIMIDMLRNGRIQNLYAVHVDYGNRNVSREEAKFVELWCKYFDISLLTRRIKHIRRKSDFDRGLYESETQKMRFNLYREGIRRFNCDCVLLGHHSDDLAENVLMNVLRHRNLMDLFTMVPFQNINNVPIGRPFIPNSTDNIRSFIKKDDIFNFAHEFEIPYLKDTTTESCLRGVLRKLNFPILLDVDPSIPKNLFGVGEESAEINEIFNKILMNPITESVKDYKLGFTLPWNSVYSNINKTWWSNLLSRIFHSRGIRMITSKNLQIFINRIKNRNSIITLSNGYNCFFESNKLVFVRKNIFMSSDNPILITPNMNELTYDGWNIRFNTITDKKLIDEYKYKTTLDELLNGKFEFIYRRCNCESDNKNFECKKCNEITDSECNNCKKKKHKVSYNVGNKYSDCKKYLKGFILSKYIPKIFLGMPCTNCRNNSIINVHVQYTHLLHN